MAQIRWAIRAVAGGRSSVETTSFGAPQPVLVGLKGDQGEKGVPGQAGEQGPPGAPGAKGVLGLEGPRGVQGEVGGKGSKGRKGSLGPRGAGGRARKGRREEKDRRDPPDPKVSMDRRDLREEWDRRGAGGPGGSLVPPEIRVPGAIPGCGEGRGTRDPLDRVPWAVADPRDIEAPPGRLDLRLQRVDPSTRPGIPRGTTPGNRIVSITW